MVAWRFRKNSCSVTANSLCPKAKAEDFNDFCQMGPFERMSISRDLYNLARREMNDLARVSGGRSFVAATLAMRAPLCARRGRHRHAIQSWVTIQPTKLATESFARSSSKCEA